jgi:hypothetical protein
MVYLLHFDQPYIGQRRNPAARKTQRAQHYIGTARSVEKRLKEHRAGRGARLLQVVTGAGITVQLARTWPGGRHVERYLKDRKHAARLCPICQSEAQP